jgi:hypothetical protein
MESGKVKWQSRAIRHFHFALSPCFVVLRAAGRDTEKEMDIAHISAVTSPHFVGERSDYGLVYQDERLRQKPMFCGPAAGLGHAGSLAIGYTYPEAEIALTSCLAVS